MTDLKKVGKNSQVFYYFGSRDFCRISLSEWKAGQSEASKNLSSGQVILLSVLLIGSSILIFSVVAGYLMTQRIRMATEFVDSTRAIFAAESGLECQLYNINLNNPGSPRNEDCAAPLYNGTLRTSASTSIYTAGSSTIVRSAGTSNKAHRAFLYVFNSP